MGLHGQQWVHTPEEMEQVIVEANGKRSVFFSHNSYPNPNHSLEPGHSCPNISDVNVVNISQQYFDLDSEKLSNALNDCRKLLEWFDNENLPYTVAFSGKKGFQVCLIFKPEVYDISETIMVDSETPVQWRSYYVAVYTYLKSILKLRTIDFQCAEPKRIMRVWNTMHFKRGATQPTGTYCVPLEPNQIHEGLPELILDWAKKPRTVTQIWNQDRTLLTFDQFLDKYQIRPNILSPLSIEYSVGLITQFKEGSGKNWEWFKKMMPHVNVNGRVEMKGCYLHEMYWNHNPTHLIRFGSAVYWKNLSDDPRTEMKIDGDWVNDFYVMMKYDDVGEPGSKEEKERWANIRSIFNRGPAVGRPDRPPYNEPSCRKLFAAGVCKGPSCGLFNVFLKELRHRFIYKDGNWLFVKEVIENE